MSKDVLLNVENVSKHFPIQKFLSFGPQEVVHAVDNVSLQIKEGETLGLVGESGSGKSTLGLTIMKLYEPTTGRIYLEGKDLTAMDRGELREVRRTIQMIFQDPYASLNPRMTIGEIVSEPFLIHKVMRGAELQERVRELLRDVGLNPAFANRYPHEFSGGQRQRCGVARALALNPKLIICDEPVSALDVSIQAQVLNLLADLQDKYGMAYLFIAHDLSVVEYVSDRVGVMYLGMLMELADTDELYKHPLHPYTIALLSANPIADPELEQSRDPIILEGDIPSPIHPPSGCRFRTRCWKATEICAGKVPEWRELREEHWVACHHAEKISADLSHLKESNR